MLQLERIGAVSDETRELIEDVLSELMHKLPPKEHHHEDSRLCDPLGQNPVVRLVYSYRLPLY